MEQAFAVCKGFTVNLWSWWLLVPFSLLSGIALLWWRRQRSTATILRTAAVVSHATRVPLLHHARPQLAQQLAHARRYERPLAVGVLSVEKEDLVERHGHWPSIGHNGGVARQWQGVPATLVTLFLVGSILRDAVRQSDIILYDAIHDHYVVLFPELSKPQALRATQRLSELLYSRTRLRVRVGIAAFPSDGLTVEALIDSARAGSTQRLVGNVTAN